MFWGRVNFMSKFYDFSQPLANAIKNWNSIFAGPAVPWDRAYALLLANRFAVSLYVAFVFAQQFRASKPKSKKKTVRKNAGKIKRISAFYDHVSAEFHGHGYEKKEPR